MHHAAAQNFKPVIALAKFNVRAGTVALNIHFHRWFSEGEETWAHAHCHGWYFEESFAEFFQYPFHIGDISRFIDNQPLHLMEHWRVGGIRIHAISFAGNN